MQIYSRIQDKGEILQYMDKHIIINILIMSLFQLNLYPKHSPMYQFLHKMFKFQEMLLVLIYHTFMLYSNSNYIHDRVVYQPN